MRIQWVRYLVTKIRNAEKMICVIHKHAYTVIILVNIPVNERFTNRGVCRSVTAPIVFTPWKHLYTGERSCLRTIYKKGWLPVYTRKVYIPIRFYWICSRMQKIIKQNKFLLISFLYPFSLMINKNFPLMLFAVITPWDVFFTNLKNLSKLNFLYLVGR